MRRYIGLEVLAKSRLTMIPPTLDSAAKVSGRSEKPRALARAADTTPSLGVKSWHGLSKRLGQALHLREGIRLADFDDLTGMRCKYDVQ
jgi:hypothetical protein